MSDAGVTGDYDSVIGMVRDAPLAPHDEDAGPRFEPALGPATLCGVAVETDAGGLALQVAPVRLGGRLSEARPAFWE